MTAPSALDLSPDFPDLLVAFADGGVEFLVVGGHAVARHGHVRATLALDVLVRPDAANAPRVVAALAAFGAPLAAHGVSAADFARPGVICQMGLPPTRIDVLTAIDGVDYDEARADTVASLLAGRTVRFIGRSALIRNKRATGRAKDVLDADALERG